MRAISDEAFPAAQNVSVAVPASRRGDPPGVGTRTRLGQAEGGEPELRRERLDERPLLRFGAGQENRSQREGVGVHRSGDARTSPGDLLLEDARIEQRQSL